MKLKQGATFGTWLDGSLYERILKDVRIITFEYNVTTGIERISPFIGECLSGSYDGRLLSEVMLEDGVLWPDDLDAALAFREQVKEGRPGEISIRLKTLDEGYKWFLIKLIWCRYDTEIMAGVIINIDSQMQCQENLRSQVERDPVSLVYQRGTFFERVREMIDREPDQSHFLFCFDIDRFKLINELYGMAEGDKVLYYIGGILQKEAGAGDIAGRLHNDVFGVCTGRSRRETEALIETIAQKVKKYPLAFRFFLPAGVVEILPGSKEPVSGLCDKAIMAQRRIKGNYLCAYLFYQPEMGAQLNREHELISNMESSLAKGQFYPWFQPQYDMRNGKIIGAEALARWRHPGLGLISPTEFVPLFERNGFIIKLDEYIWESTCRYLREWMDCGISPPPVSVNVSRVHLYDAGFCQKVIELCRRYSIPPRLLELEITESAYTERPQELFPIMDQLCREGFIFAMDDFGSGYSSLNMLKDIPVKMIKFDLRFLEDTPDSQQTSHIILENTIRLVKELHLTVLAEGVENEQQVRFLQEAGCYYAQGYYYSMPMPPEELKTLLEKG